jgi:hypothetical protein
MDNPPIIIEQTIGSQLDDDKEFQCEENANGTRYNISVPYSPCF